MKKNFSQCETEWNFFSFSGESVKKNSPEKYFLYLVSKINLYFFLLIFEKNKINSHCFTHEKKNP